VEAGVRVVTAAEATLYGAVIAGTFTLLGMMIERLLRLVGFLRFSASGWDTTYLGGEDNFTYGMVDDPKDATEVRYRVAIDMFNGREVPTCLRNARVEMILTDGPHVESRPDYLVARVPSQSSKGDYNQLTVLNVPPRQFVHKELHGSFGREAIESYRDNGWRRIDFVADWPKRPFFGILGRKTYRKTIATRPPNRDPFA